MSQEGGRMQIFVRRISKISGIIGLYPLKTLPTPTPYPVCSPNFKLLPMPLHSGVTCCKDRYKSYEKSIQIYRQFYHPNIDNSQLSQVSLI